MKICEKIIRAIYLFVNEVYKIEVQLSKVTRIIIIIFFIKFVTFTRFSPITSKISKGL